MSDEERIFIEVPQISLEDQQKYRGKDVAIVDGKVVAAGYSSVEVFRKARELFPNKSSREIIIADIPMEDMLILWQCFHSHTLKREPEMALSSTDQEW